MWSKVTFDFKAAEAEIRRRKQALDVEEMTWSLEGDAASEEALADLRIAADREPVDQLEPMSRLDERLNVARRTEEARETGDEAEPASPRVPASPRRPPFLGRSEEDEEEALEGRVPRTIWRSRT